jgi:hypothetical protein
MKKISTLKKLANIANNLDALGFFKEAQDVTLVMKKIAQYIPSNPLAPAQQAIIDNIGTPTVVEGAKSINEGADRAIHDLSNILSATYEMGKGIGVGTVGLIEMPIQGSFWAQKALTDRMFAPYVQAIQDLQQDNNQKRKLLKIYIENQNKQGADKIINEMIENFLKIKYKAVVLSNIAARKDSNQYMGDIADFQNTINYSVKNSLTIRQMYDYAVQNRGGGPAAKNYANNLIAKYRTIHPDAQDAKVKPTNFS